MIAPLLATALTLRAPHLPVRHAAQPSVGLHAPQRVDDSALNLFSYCDAKGQTWVMVTNVGPTAFVVEWTLTAVKPGYPPDRWSSVSRVEPTQFEGWMSPAPYLHLEVRYDDDGVPATKSIDAYCSAMATAGNGLDAFGRGLEQ